MYALQEKNDIKFSESNLAVTGQVNSENYNNNSNTRNWMNFNQMLLQLKRNFFLLPTVPYCRLSSSIHTLSLDIWILFKSLKKLYLHSGISGTTFRLIIFSLVWFPWQTSIYLYKKWSPIQLKKLWHHFIM